MAQGLEGGWAREEDAQGGVRPVGDEPGELRLGSDGIEHRSGGGVVRVPWPAVFGVFVLEEEPREAELFVLVPRRPPMPPWLRVRASGVPPELRARGLAGVAEALRARLGQRGYREPAAQRPRLSPAELLAEVRAHRVIPGALEVPVGAGPEGRRGRRRRIERGVVTGAGMGVALAAAAHAAPATAPLLVAAGALGAIAGGFYASGRARLRGGRRRRKRVLVLAPDGAVVGLPTGVRSFAWSDIGHFAAERYESPRSFDASEARSCLTVADAEGTVLGRVDATWFAAPLPLIVAVAEAYRARVAPASRS